MDRINTDVPVVVIYRGGIGAVAIARTLARLGVRMYLVAQKEAPTPVWYSRYWSGKFLWDFSCGEQQSVEFLLSIARRIGTRPILLTLADWVAIFIERNAQALREGFIFPQTAPPLIRELSDKWGMYRLAKQHGVPTPETVLPRSHADVESYLETAAFPIVMKGADAFLPLPEKAIVRDRRELFERFNDACRNGSPNVILQEYIPGDAAGVWMCNAYFAAGSRPLAVLTGRKLRQVSETGIACLAVCLPNDAVRETTRRFMQDVGYEGPLDVGYRYDPRDGSYKLLDVNPRVGGAFRLFTTEDNMDVVRLCYLDLTQQPAVAGRACDGRKWMIEQDVQEAVGAIRNGRLSFREWIASIRGVQEVHWFAADDPLPFFVWLQRKLRDIIGPKATMWRRAAAAPPARG